MRVGRKVKCSNSYRGFVLTWPEGQKEGNDFWRKDWQEGGRGQIAPFLAPWMKPCLTASVLCCVLCHVETHKLRTHLPCHSMILWRLNISNNMSLPLLLGIIGSFLISAELCGLKRFVAWPSFSSFFSLLCLAFRLGFFRRLMDGRN